MHFADKASMYFNSATKQRIVVGAVKVLDSTLMYSRTKSALIISDEIYTGHLLKVGSVTYNEAVELLTLPEEAYFARVSKLVK